MAVLSSLSSVMINDERCYGARVINSGTAIEIDFPQSNSLSQFHAPWLWSNNPTHVLLPSGQRSKTPGHFPVGTKITAASLVSSDDEGTRATMAADEQQRAVIPVPAPQRGCSHPIGTYSTTTKGTVDETKNQAQLFLRVAWESREKFQSVSYYDVDWLHRWRYDDNAMIERRKQSEVTKEHAIEKIQDLQDDVLTKVDYSSIMASESEDDAIFELLQAIIRDGAAIVKNTPSARDDKEPVSKIGRTLGGALSHGSLYGDTFTVKSMPNAKNVAFTSLALRPHQDMAYYESAPGLQLLHCVANHNVIGGESFLIDAMAAAYEFRRIAPKHFETLVNCPATFVKQRENADIVCHRPHIVLKEGNGTNDINREIVSVTWSPPFEGPACLPSHLMEDYYVAYAAFEQMLDKSLPPDYNDGRLPPDMVRELRAFCLEHTWERKLNAGETLVFNNQRMLHGRREFSTKGEVQDVGRHLIGCYTNIDDTVSNYRVRLREQTNTDRFAALNVGNGTSFLF